MSLTPNYTFVGEGNWSIDGVGGQATGGGTLSADIPEGSQVEAAFLYSTVKSGSLTSATLTYGSAALTADNFTSLGRTAELPEYSFYLEGYRADVTTFIQQAVGDGDDATFDFNLSGINGTGVDGFALVIVYSNPDESTRTISLLDGASATTGDDFTLSFAEPVDTAPEGFEAQLSLGIGYGYQPTGQSSTVTVNGRLLTSSAGGQDDGTNADNSLITIGGIGDSTDNPDPTASGLMGPRIDDELYDLAKGNSADATPFLANGSTSLTISTLNPTNDDIIFFAGINITAVADVQAGDNVAPVVASAIADQLLAEDTAWSFAVPTNTFTDADDDPLTFTASLSDNTALPSWLSFDGQTRTFSGTPPTNYNGSLSLQVTASDGSASVSDSFTLTVTPVNDAPTDLVIDNASIAENLAPGALVGTLSAADVDGDALTYSLVDTANGRFAVNAATGAVTATGSFNYEADASKSYQILARVEDEDGLAVEKSISIAVLNVNEAPVAVGDSITVAEDATTGNLWSQLLANDSDADAGAVLRISAINTSNTLGSVVFDPNTQTLRYIADDDSFNPLTSGAQANDSFTYTVTDEQGLTSTATVQVSVTGIGNAGALRFGTRGSDTLVGTAGDDRIEGREGNDTLSGLDGDDRIWGGEGRDSLIGGAGNDTLAGEESDDRLTGGSGRDNFVIGYLGGKDTITDFNVNDDMLTLGSWVFVSKTKVSDVDHDGRADLTLTFGGRGPEASVTLLGISNYSAVHIEHNDNFISQGPF